jgi:hypothetical protein
MQSVSTLQAAHAALEKHLQQQLITKRTQGRSGKLLSYPPYRMKYDSLHKQEQAKGARCTDGTGDPQDNTSESTYTPEEWLKMNDAYMTKGTLAASRDQALATLAHHTVGRSDDIRSFHLADIVAPRLYLNIGEQHAGSLSSWRRCP